MFLLFIIPFRSLISLGSPNNANLDSTNSTCVSVTKVNGCTQVASGPLSSSSYNCTACNAETHFLSSSKCNIRTFIENCETYNLSQDGCSLCSEHYYLSVDKLSCIKAPVGVPNCTVHASSGTLCDQCESDFYVSTDQSECLSLTTEEKTTSCVKYDSTKKCVKCGSGFFLKSSTSCETITALNCLTLKDESSCATCSNMFYLNPNLQSNPRHCLTLSINNCLTNNVEKCSLCKNNFKLAANSLSCESVTKTVPNCVAYDSNENCTRCVSPFILNRSLNICIMEESLDSLLDPNCNAFQLSPTCNTCKAGYFFDQNGICQKCSAENCHFCERGGVKCTLCLTGYYMEISEICKKNPNAKFDETLVVEEGTNSAHIWRLMNSLLLLIVMVIV